MKKLSKRVWVLLKESKGWIKASFFIFLIAGFLGAATFFFRVLPTFFIISKSLSEIVSLSAKAQTLDLIQKWFLIYQNNLTSMIIMLLGGLILGLFSFIGLLVNGLILGFFLFFVSFANLPVFTRIVVLLLILPHGVIELSLLMIAAAWGMKLGLEYFLPKAKGKRFSIFVLNLKNSFWIFGLLVLGLALAAAVEVLDMKILETLVR